MRKGLVTLVLGLLCGCATSAKRSQAPAASRIYVAAESRVQQGAYDEASLLLRHALLQLPSDASSDELRHKLILRIAYVELLAWASTGHRVHLEDAEQMLHRYLERHEVLFGDMPGARAARGEVYEILYEVEQRLEMPEPPMQLAQAGQHAGEDSAATLAPPAADEKAETSSAPARSKARVAKKKSANDDAAVVSAAQEEVRKVRVRSQRHPDVNDPEVRKQLQGKFFNPDVGLLLTKPTWFEYVGPRALVRVGGIPRAVESGSAHERRRARTAARSLVAAAREELRTCFEGAYVRQPMVSAQSTVELSIHPDGTVSSVRIVDGGLDGFGDACVIEQLQSARVESDELVATQRVELPIEFIYMDTVMLHEATFSRQGPSRREQVTTAPDALTGNQHHLRPVR